MDKKIKVLHIIKSLGRGGAEMLLPETLKLHDKTHFDFHYIYFLPWKDQMVSNIQSNGGKVVCLKSNNNLQLMLRVNDVAEYVRKNNITLIHAHLPWAGVLARIAARRTRVPVIYTEHNKQERYHFATRFMNLATINLTHEVVAVSADVEQSIRTNKKGLVAPVRTILNGVNTQHFRRMHIGKNLIRRQLGIPDNSPIVGTIAVFRFQKRLDIWLEQAFQILRQHPHTHFIIVGDGPLKSQITEKRKALGLTDRVHMPGLEQEVRPYLEAFDIFMMSSIFEGLPIALLEAMSMECPVVATNAGGVGEVVANEVEGLLCDVQEPDRLSLHVSKLLSDAEMRKTLASNARHRIEKSFSMAKMVGELEGLYNEVALKGNCRWT